MSEKQKSATRVVTSKVRFCYVHAFEPTAMDEKSDKKYSITVLVPKRDKKMVERLEGAVKAALEEGKTKLGGKIPATWKNPLRDGDEERPDDETFEGVIFFNANSARKPGVVDENLDPIIDKDEFYSGCYGRASINFYAFNTSGNKGVAVGLNNLQKLEDGERLSGDFTTPEDDFGDQDELM